jgi:hypothetical protein
MKQINVEPLPIAGHASAVAALRSSEQETHDWIARTHLDSRFGQTIVDARWNDGCVLLRLSSGEIIGISCSQDGVVCDTVSAASFTVIHEDDDPVVELAFGDWSVIWDRKRLINDLIGRALSLMQMSDGMLFVYAGKLLIGFSVMRDPETGNLLLHWCESQ